MTYRVDLMEEIFNHLNYLSANLRDKLNLRHHGKQNETLAQIVKKNMWGQGHIKQHMAQKGSLWNHHNSKIQQISHSIRDHLARQWGQELFIIYFINSIRKTLFLHSFCTHMLVQRTQVSVWVIWLQGALSAFSLVLQVHFIIVLFQICCAWQGRQMEDANSVWDEQESLTQMWWFRCRMREDLKNLACFTEILWRPGEVRPPLWTELKLKGWSLGSKTAPEVQSPHFPLRHLTSL